MIKNNFELIIIGIGGHAKVCVDICKLNKIKIAGHIVDRNIKSDFVSSNNFNIIGKIPDINNLHKRNYKYFIAVGDNKNRKKIFENLKNKYEFINLYHPSSILSKNVSLGKNILVNSGVIINTNVSIADNSIINTGSIIDHDVNIGSNSHICPGVKIAGSVIINNDVFVGIGTSIINDIKIGKNVIIGAGSVVIHNILNNSKVAGIPAKKI